MRFLAEDSEQAEPSEAELAEHLAAHPAEYQIPERVRFRQLFFSFDRRGDDARARAAAALAAAQPGPAELGGGDPFPGNDPRAAPATAAELAKLGGARFAAQALAAPIGRWSGPLESTLGVHLIFVEERRPAEPIPLAQARPRVRIAALEERR